MIDKKERQETVDFIDYLESGVTFMVAKGNPKGLKDKIDLCGKTAAVEKSSTGDLSVDDITKECTAAGKPAVVRNAHAAREQNRELDGTDAIGDRAHDVDRGVVARPFETGHAASNSCTSRCCKTIQQTASQRNRSPVR